GDCPTARHRRGLDVGLDEPRRRADQPRRGPRLLLVARAAEIMAQGRDLGAGPAPPRNASRLRWRCGLAAGRPAWRRLPHRTAQLLFPGGARWGMDGDRGPRDRPGRALSATRPIASIWRWAARSRQRHRAWIHRTIGAARVVFVDVGVIARD